MRKVVDLRRIDPELRQLAVDLASSLPTRVIVGADSIPPAEPAVTAESLGVPVVLVDRMPGHAVRRRRRKS